VSENRCPALVQTASWTLFVPSSLLVSRAHSTERELVIAVQRFFQFGYNSIRTVTDDATRRGQRVYDTWAEYGVSYRVVDRLTRSLRRNAVRELDPDTGETVVDLGCGPGGSFSLLATAVEPAGDVLGVDYSSTMVRSAGNEASDIPSASVL